MAVNAKEIYLRKKFFSAFMWTAGTSTVFSLIFFGIIIENSALFGKIMMINILGALILGLFAGIFAMLIPSSMKIIYVPASLVITYTISFLISSAVDPSMYIKNVNQYFNKNDPQLTKQQATALYRHLKRYSKQETEEEYGVFTQDLPSEPVTLIDDYGDD